MYHGRDVAVMRASMLGMPCVLWLGHCASLRDLEECAGRAATSWTRCPKRVDDRPMPAFRIVDMRREGCSTSGGEDILSRAS
jgi:primosomal protein N'